MQTSNARNQTSRSFGAANVTPAAAILFLRKLTRPAATAILQGVAPNGLYLTTGVGELEYGEGAVLSRAWRLICGSDEVMGALVCFCSGWLFGGRDGCYGEE
ncbi:hypothetical protein BDBG_06768 [Blastomyces gilchristii SLH14081]|uniref:Uncharacterized protein n=2 Tax=Blastomyces TaxID=229219 RepID=A0A179UVD6_BLAGS|nr:uncharacterized protein BDBG_06768 [Blastomyces gilchristii SLH14081]EGE78931.1 hypothetical protein BDDG_01868 [Blastomyces dermatitidis ATCC 18188]OAT11011.1 hypothetical protein BDBG_06768 [Blastomyces gilchristii SLH14081]